jgi:hypothetical protein
MVDFTILRTLRTPTSERFLFRHEDKDLASLDLHYHADGTVDGTLIAFEGAGLAEAQIPEFLSQIDETLLPNVSFAEKNLSFTVVIGRALGAFVPHDG